MATTIVRIASAPEARGGELVGELLQALDGWRVLRLSVVARQRAPAGPDLVGGAGEIGDGPRGQRADTRQRAQLDPGPEIGELHELGHAQVRPDQLFQRVGHEHPLAGTEGPGHCEVLVGTDVTRRQHRIVLATQRRDLVHHRKELAVVVDHDESGPRDAELRGDPVHDVLA